MITIGDEFELIWQRKWGIANWLFLVNRYSVVLCIVLHSSHTSGFEVSVAAAASSSPL